MSEWTEEELRAQGYQLDPDHPANLGERSRLDRQIDVNAAHREALLPSAAAGPLGPQEHTAPQTEIERLFPDRERVRVTQEAIATLRGLV